MSELLPVHEQLREELRKADSDDPITSKELAERVGIADSEANPVTRASIRELIELTGLPIGACNQGYYVIECRGELSAYLRRLDARKHGITERQRLVAAAFETDGEQVRLGEVER